MMRDFRASRCERIASDIRYFFKWQFGDFIAALATVGAIIIAPILMALGR